MPGGKWHALIGFTCCIIAQVAISVLKGLAGWFFLLIPAGAIVALGPDVDEKWHIFAGHRNGIIFHSPLIPGYVGGIILAAYFIVPPVGSSAAFWCNLGLEFGALWCIAHGSHVLADLSSTAKNCDVKPEILPGRPWL